VAPFEGYQIVRVHHRIRVALSLGRDVDDDDGRHERRWVDLVDQAFTQSEVTGRIHVGTDVLVEGPPLCVEP
jgi:hypothetical protein